MEVRAHVSLCLLPGRVLQSMWELLLRMILDAVGENRGIQVEFYNRFQYAVEVSYYHTILCFHDLKGCSRLPFYLLLTFLLECFRPCCSYSMQREKVFPWKT